MHSSHCYTNEVLCGNSSFNLCGVENKTAFINNQYFPISSRSASLFSCVQYTIIEPIEEREKKLS